MRTGDEEALLSASTIGNCLTPTCGTHGAHQDLATRSRRMTMRFGVSLATLMAIAMVGACAPDESGSAGNEEGSEDELRLCRPFAPTLADRTAGKQPLLGNQDVEVAATLEHP